MAIHFPGRICVDIWWNSIQLWRNSIRPWRKSRQTYAAGQFHSSDRAPPFPPVPTPPLLHHQTPPPPRAPLCPAQPPTPPLLRHQTPPPPRAPLRPAQPPPLLRHHTPPPPRAPLRPAQPPPVLCHHTPPPSRAPLRPAQSSSAKMTIRELWVTKKLPQISTPDGGDPKSCTPEGFFPTPVSREAITLPAQRTLPVRQISDS
ncbi:uncharacterized protein [Aristolochia californica]|uniref:uncharacterized protein n=1 Tax=Aristolochia californica TaxID=171875 RepID=UPI0035D9BFEF